MPVTGSWPITQITKTMLCAHLLLFYHASHHFAIVTYKTFNAKCAVNFFCFSLSWHTFHKASTFHILYTALNFFSYFVVHLYVIFGIVQFSIQSHHHHFFLGFTFHLCSLAHLFILQTSLSHLPISLTDLLSVIIIVTLLYLTFLQN